MGKCREEAGMSGRYELVEAVNGYWISRREPNGGLQYLRGAKEAADELNALLDRAEKAETALNEAIARGMAAETRSVTLKTLLGALRSMLEDQHHRAEEALKAAKVAYLMDLAKHEEKLRFERERINRVSALLKQRGYAPIDGAVGAYAEGLVAVFRDLDEAHARAERAESEFRGVARMQA